MYVLDKDWDDLVDCSLKLIEAIEEVPRNIVYPYREATLIVLYNIVHREDQKIPRKKRKKKVKLLS
jgi:hypothetical protein